MNTSERIKHRMRSLEIKAKDVVKLTGASKGAVSQWVNGVTKPDGYYLLALSKALQCDPNWLLHGDQNEVNESMQSYSAIDEHSNTTQGPEILGRVPLISMVQAGNFCEAIDLFQPGDAEEWIACPANHSDQSYALRVQGESMLPRFTEGEIIIVDPNVSPDSGKFVIARRNSDQKTTFKQLMKDDGDFYLKALNPEWSDRYIRMTEEWHVCGVVICKIDML